MVCLPAVLDPKLHMLMIRSDLYSLPSGAQCRLAPDEKSPFVPNGPTGIPMIMPPPHLAPTHYEPLLGYSVPSKQTLAPSNKLRIRKRPVPLGGGGYRCDCGREYQAKSALNYHRKWICSSQERFRCGLCHYKAKRYYCFKEHLERKHLLKAQSKNFYLNGGVDQLPSLNDGH